MTATTTAAATPPLSPLAQLRRVDVVLEHITAHPPATEAPKGWPGTAEIRKALAPAIEILEALETHPEIRPAPAVRNTLLSIEQHYREMLAGLKRTLEVIKGDRFELDFHLERLTWCRDKLRELAFQSWHEEPPPRKPVAVAHTEGGYVYVVCDDGAVFLGSNGDDWSEIRGRTSDFAAIPDSMVARRRRDAAVAEEVSP